MAEMTASAKVKRHRSPNYPSLELEKAIERVRVLSEKGRNHPIGIGTATEWWGYKRGSASSQQCVAALKAYGLIDVSGVRDSREIAPSSDARKILRDSPEAPRIIQDAALRPPVFLKLYEKYDGPELPDDAAVLDYLVEDLKFNEDVVPTVIARYKATIAHAKLASDDESSPLTGDDENNHHDTEENEAGKSVTHVNDDPPLKESRDMKAPPPPPSGTRQDVFTVPEGSFVLQWPSNLTPQSIEDFEEYFPIFIRKVRRGMQAGQPSTGSD